MTATVDVSNSRICAPPGGDEARIELTEHAREWIERIWAPLREGGAVAVPRIRRVISRSCTRSWSERAPYRNGRSEPREVAGPASVTCRKAHLRGGLSPAALRRVQLFVEANLSGRFI